MFASVITFTTNLLTTLLSILNSKIFIFKNYLKLCRLYISLIYTYKCKYEFCVNIKNAILMLWSFISLWGRHSKKLWNWNPCLSGIVSDNLKWEILTCFLLFYLNILFQGKSNAVIWVHQAVPVADEIAVCVCWRRIHILF